MSNALVTGALGQIGSELVPLLRSRAPESVIVATDLRPDETGRLSATGPSEQLDATDVGALRDLVARHGVRTIYHLAAILSASAERDPLRSWRVNMDSLIAVLEVARESGCAVFVPSSIAAFGPSTPRLETPQDTIQRPATLYGITKVAGELLCDYYWSRHGVDTRGLRFPGIISYKTEPGGGTTDYAVEIFHAAVRDGRYTCFLAPDTRIDMMYIPDALTAIVSLMEADGARLLHRNAFNVTAMSLTPEILASEIRKHLPDFAIEYDVDPRRQAIADSWPASLDDSAACEEWSWTPEWTLAAMTADMLEHIAERHAAAVGGHVAKP